jgi:hypothetical protein
MGFPKLWGGVADREVKVRILNAFQVGNAINYILLFICMLTKDFNAHFNYLSRYGSETTLPLGHYPNIVLLMVFA